MAPTDFGKCLRMMYRFDPWQLDSSARELWRDGVRVTAPRRVFDLLLYLLEQRERAVGRDELVAAVWGRVDVADVQVSQLIARARKLINDDAQTQAVIRTIAGFGYRWVQPLNAAQAASIQVSADSLQLPVQAPNVSAAPATPTQASAIEPLALSEPPVVQPQPGSRRSLPRWSLLAALLAALTLSLWLLWPGRADLPRAAAVNGALVILPIAVNGAPEDDWIGLGGMDLVASRLRRAGVLVVPSESVLAALHAAREQDPHAPETVLLKMLGATRTVSGSALRVPLGWRISLQTLDLDGVAITASAEAADPMLSANQATDRLLQALGHANAPGQTAPAALAEQVQRIRAAILVADLPGARHAFAQVPEPLRGHPRMRLIQAEMDYHSGLLDVAAVKLEALLDDAELTRAERSRVLLARGMLAMRMGECVHAEQRFSQALSVADSGAEARSGNANAWAGRGLARSCLGQVTAAADDLGLARLHMEALSDALGVARVDNYLGVLEVQRGAPARALDYFQSALRSFDALVVVDAQRAVLSGMLDAQLQVLDWNAAQASAQRLLELRAQVTDPMQQQILDSDRARVLIGSGQLTAAARLLDSAGALPARGAAQRWLAFSRAELSWRQGDASATAQHAAQALIVWPDTDHDHRYLRLQLMAQQAAGVLQHPWVPLPPAPGNESADSSAATEQPNAALVLLLQARVVSTDSSSATSPGQIEALYQSALQHAEQQGVPASVLWVVADFANWQLQRGNIQAAASLIGRILPWAERDFDAALLRCAVFHAQADQAAWARGLTVATQLAGEREIPAYLQRSPLAALSGSTPLSP